tara:strand:+ start:66 stop:245 length:180 start_codon:yes stop_codon:yes gene_type:complete
MTTAVYFNDKIVGNTVLIAVFLMRSDADAFAKNYVLTDVFVKDLPIEAWTDFSNILGYI